MSRSRTGTSTDDRVRRLREQAAEYPLTEFERLSHGCSGTLGGRVGVAHARRWSSDRKKLIVVQTESKALHPSSPRLPNQTITPLAFDPTPCGVAAKCSDSPQ